MVGRLSIFKYCYIEGRKTKRNRVKERESREERGGGGRNDTIAKINSMLLPILFPLSTMASLRGIF
jgi:hypothetical protein